MPLSPSIGAIGRTTHAVITAKICRYAKPNLSLPPYIQTGGSHWPGIPLYGPCADCRPWSASPDGLTTPPRPGCETVPISEARHVPDTALIGPRLARVSKIYAIVRLISVLYAERQRNTAIGGPQQGGRMVVFSVLCCNFSLGGLRELPPRRAGHAFLRIRCRQEVHALAMACSDYRILTGCSALCFTARRVVGPLLICGGRV